MLDCYECNIYFSAVYPSAPCVSKNCALSDLMNEEATILCILLTVPSKTPGVNSASNRKEGLPYLYLY